MKLRLCKALTLSLMAACALPQTFADNTLNVYILTGQSNSLGAVKGSPASQQLLDQYSTAGTTDIQMWNGNVSAGDNNTKACTLYADGTHEAGVWFTVRPQEPGDTVQQGANSPYYAYPCMGPEYGFAYMMSKKGWNVFGSDSIAIVKSSLDGKGNSWWVQPEEGETNLFYKQILKTVAAALEQVPNIDGTNYTTVNIAGLLYLQGESNEGNEVTEAAVRYGALVENLTNDLKEAGYNVTLNINSEMNSVAGESATWADAAKTGNSTASAAALRTRSDETDGMGFVFTRDLTKITSGDTYDVHYDGKSQITIGARYAYAMALQEDKDVTEGGTVSVRSDYYNDYDYKGTAVSLNDREAWWDGGTDKSAVTVVWDVSSANQEDTLSGDFTVGGIRVEDPFRDTVVIKNLAQDTNATLTIGSGGIKLEGADLTIDTNLNLSSVQEWILEDNRTLTINGSIYQKDGSAVDLTLGSGSTLDLSSGNGTVSFSSLTWEDGASISLSGDDTIALTGTASGADRLDFNINFDKNTSAGTYTLVNGWNEAVFRLNDFTYYKGLTVTQSISDNALTFTVTGSAATDDFSVEFPDNPIEANKDSTYASCVFASGNATGGNNYVLLDTNATGVKWAAVAFNRPNGAQQDLYLKIVGTSSAWGGVYGAWNFSSASECVSNGNLYLEFDAGADVTYGAASSPGSVTGMYGTNVRIDGDLTIVIRDGTFSNYVIAGAGGMTTGTVKNGVYLQIDNGNFSRNVYGGSLGSNASNVAAGTIKGGVHMLIKYGTFTGDVFGGNGAFASNSIINGGVEMNISDGTFSKVYGGNQSSGTINGGVEMNISGGSFQIVYGGNSSSSAIIGNVTINISGSGEFGTIYGGNELASNSNVGTISGNVTMNISGNGTFGTIYGGNHAYGTISGSTNLNISGGTFASIYGGSNGCYGSATYSGGTIGSVNIDISSGNFESYVFGGSENNGTITGGVTMNISGGSFAENVFAGSYRKGSIGGGVLVTISDNAEFSKEVFGGNCGANSTINGGVNLTINGGTFKGNVYAGGWDGTVNGDVNLTISGGDFSGNIYAGVKGNGSFGGGATTVTLKDIDDNNTFADFAGTLDGARGGEEKGTLKLDHFTAESVNATVENFGKVSVENETHTKMSSLGGATVLAVKGTSRLQVELADDATVSATDISVETGSALQVTNSAYADQSVTVSAKEGETTASLKVGALSEKSVTGGTIRDAVVSFGLASAAAVSLDDESAAASNSGGSASYTLSGVILDNSTIELASGTSLALEDVTFGATSGISAQDGATVTTSGTTTQKLDSSSITATSVTTCDGGEGGQAISAIVDTSVLMSIGALTEDNRLRLELDASFFDSLMRKHCTAEASVLILTFGELGENSTYFDGTAYITVDCASPFGPATLTAAEGDRVVIGLSAAIPEPAAATLSLLALAALAARRRRK